MPKENRNQMTSVGESIAHAADAITLTSNPDRRAAAEAWLKKIHRELAKLRKSGPGPAKG
jgi:hypothetical protein